MARLFVKQKQNKKPLLNQVSSVETTQSLSPKSPTWKATELQPQTENIKDRSTDMIECTTAHKVLYIMLFTS